MIRRRVIGGVLLLTVLLGVSRDAAEACTSEPKVLAYHAYVTENLCPNDNPDGCLQPTSYIATRSDGRRVRVTGVYRWLHEHAIWKDADGVERVHLLPHFVLTYMRALRDAYEVCPDQVFLTQLYNQIDYVMSRTVTRGTVFAAARVWENRYGVAQGMEQAEMAGYLASVARLYAKLGRREAPGTMRFAFQVVQSLFIPVGVGTGGVRSVVQDRCGAKLARLRPCFWFHSRGVGIDTAEEDQFGTVLNQHLHVISDVLGMYKNVSRVPHLIPPEQGDEETALARLKDRAIGGLYQLAFSRGNNSAAPTRPPNLAQFMRPLLSWLGQPFYFSWYRFDLSNRTFNNITWERTCHYHTHSLAKMKNIKETLDGNVDLFAPDSPTDEGWRLYEAMDRIFKGAGERWGQAGSTSAIWQFWLSQQQKYSFTVVACPRCHENGKIVPCEGDSTVKGYYSKVW
jgi:hypothetical protein